ncbi:MAG TPA: hypothetical protein VGY31_07175 [Terriglobia bacterium]|nr:hypothetical protein [Terriglobia bacterium]
MKIDNSVELVKINYYGALLTGYLGVFDQSCSVGSEATMFENNSRRQQDECGGSQLHGTFVATCMIGVSETAHIGDLCFAQSGSAMVGAFLK